VPPEFRSFLASSNSLCSAGLAGGYSPKIKFWAPTTSVASVGSGEWEEEPVVRAGSCGLFGAHPASRASAVRSNSLPSNPQDMPGLFWPTAQISLRAGLVHQSPSSCFETRPSTTRISARPSCFEAKPGGSSTQSNIRHKKLAVADPDMRADQHGIVIRQIDLRVNDPAGGLRPRRLEPLGLAVIQVVRMHVAGPRRPWS